MMQVFLYLSPSQFILINGQFFPVREKKKKEIFLTIMVSIIYSYKNGRRTLKCSSNTTINQAQIRTMCNVHHHNKKNYCTSKKRIKNNIKREILYIFAWHSSKIFIFFASAPLLGSSNMQREKKNCAGFFHLISHSHINLIFMHIFFLYVRLCVCLYICNL